MEFALISAFIGNVGNTACLRNGDASLGLMHWTSGQRLIENDCNSSFAWKISSDKLLAFDFTYWDKGDPNCWNNNEFCALIFRNFKWIDLPCSDKFCPLCEYTPTEFDPISFIP